MQKAQILFRQGRRITLFALLLLSMSIGPEGDAMTRIYDTVDADGHILEPLTLWDDYIDPAFRDRRPQHVIDENGAGRISVEGKLLGNPRGIGSLG